MNVAPPHLRWPPPGLERMQGDLWRIATRAGLAGGLMVLPLLFVVARDYDFASLGPFGDAWWVTLVPALVGLGFAVDALVTAARLLARTERALERGYDLGTVALVAVDVHRDMGFLLQGQRHYSVLDEKGRGALRVLRVSSAALLAVAALWLSVGFVATVFMAARGWLTSTGMWMVTLLPAGALFAAGGALNGVAEGQVRRARREWHSHPWAEDLVEGEIAEWRRRRSEFADGREAGREGRRRRAAALSRWAVLPALLAVLVAVPVVTLAPTSAIGPILAAVSIPPLGRVQERAAQVEAYRDYRVPVDSSITAAEAGELLHDLVNVGRTSVAPGERPPVRPYAQDWLPRDSGAGNPLGVEPHRWGAEVFGVVAAGASPAVLDYLERVASHPAHAEISRLARATELDVAGARWELPFARDLTLASLPIPPFGALRAGMYAHLAAAGHELATGHPERAEEKVREVISVGLLLGDQGPTLIDNLIGHVVARGGGEALLALYDATGRDGAARVLRGLTDATQRSVRRIRVSRPEGVEAYVRTLPGTVLDQDAALGLRWESLVLVTTLSPCLNLHRIVFGPEESYRAFLHQAHDALVRRPSEEELFRLARAGYLGAFADESPGWFGRVLAVTMRGGEGSCADLVGQLKLLDRTR